MTEEWVTRKFVLDVTMRADVDVWQVADDLLTVLGNEEEVEAIRSYDGVDPIDPPTPLIGRSVPPA